jgi:hypothetical protein
MKWEKLTTITFNPTKIMMATKLASTAKAKGLPVMIKKVNITIKLAMNRENRKIFTTHRLNSSLNKTLPTNNNQMSYHKMLHIFYSWMPIAMINCLNN